MPFIQILKVFPLYFLIFCEDIINNINFSGHYAAIQTSFYTNRYSLCTQLRIKNLLQKKILIF
jgi:hypothetical protein